MIIFIIYIYIHIYIYMYVYAYIYAQIYIVNQHRFKEKRYLSKIASCSASFKTLYYISIIFYIYTLHVITYMKYTMYLIYDYIYHIYVYIYKYMYIYIYILLYVHYICHITFFIQSWISNKCLQLLILSRTFPSPSPLVFNLPTFNIS